MRRWAVALLLSSLVPLSACASSKQAQPTARILVSATEQVDTARFETTYDLEGKDVDHSAGAQVLDGVIDFAHDTGYAVARTVPVPGATTTIDPSIPPDLQNDTPVETRWIGAVSYGQTTGEDFPLPGANPRLKWVKTDGARVAAANPCHHGVVASAASLVTGVSNPMASIDALRTNGYRLRFVGRDKVRGVDTTHWRLTLPPRPTVTTTVQCRRPTSRSSVEIEVWSDAKQRIRRVRISSTSPGRRVGGDVVSPTTFVRTTDLYDFGVAVHVSAPPASEVYDNTTAMAELQRGEGTLAGGWRVVAHGSANGKPWTVWFARTTTGWRCHDSQGVNGNDGAVVSVDESTDGRVPPPIKRDGHVVQCEPRDVTFGPLFSSIGLLHHGDTTTLVGLFDGTVTTARLHLADGTSVPFAFDHDTGIGVWTGSGTPTGVQAGASTCSLQPVASPSVPAFPGNMCMGAFG